MFESACWVGAQWLSGRVRALLASLSCGHIYPSLVLVQTRTTCPYMTERLLMGHKNQIKQDKFDEFISPDEGLFERNM